MNKVYLLIGGNMGNREEQLKHAIELIHNGIGNVAKVSSLYETAAWGKTDQPAFLNQALLVNTHLQPLDLLQHTLAIEQEMGRKRMEKNGPRTIDIDIMFYNHAVIDEPSLTVPHPAMAQRRFVLEPLAELAPDFQHPVHHKSITQLLDECTDPLPVKRLK
ncbi:2-amino-4-hydroxy-6-hydroxymethyldihydropteridine diphosphokinase [Pseudoflavitalea sp. G-6-1-2]|uniref:2-amino-4-hydroxy-6- hydroxymethyldihydropteridine diphosphokinase n=1 Tax=Pseudoflavitalea sp. G-6-1-2 TaxID=2728841 RepID=UPI00146B5DCF|nr:2-amino-4-hydroxy-6-hydroxymethyldihydropteridine diphosphokinase [Pseudoflavitalea sp. G-6-1-2]NML21066.1 2-amino-4-hydroxy-6-hydroxymethyldihydropteridine diphosphokinase [Pseudoflavitalea sp. G-6-1-2]